MMKMKGHIPTIRMRKMTMTRAWFKTMKRSARVLRQGISFSYQIQLSKRWISQARTSWTLFKQLVRIRMKALTARLSIVFFLLTKLKTRLPRSSGKETAHLETARPHHLLITKEQGPSEPLTPDRNHVFLLQAWTTCSQEVTWHATCRGQRRRELAVFTVVINQSARKWKMTTWALETNLARRSARSFDKIYLFSM